MGKTIAKIEAKANVLTVPPAVPLVARFSPTEDGLRLTAARHYILVPKDGLTDADLATYQTMNALP